MLLRTRSLFALDGRGFYNHYWQSVAVPRFFGGRAECNRICILTAKFTIPEEHFVELVASEITADLNE